MALVIVALITLAAAHANGCVLLLPLVSPAVLPPGYEDTPWCPPGSCLEQTRQPDGFTGPQSAFVHCHDPESKVLALGAREVQEIWTGSKVATEPPDGWVVASPCPPHPMPPPPPSSPGLSRAPQIVVGGGAQLGETCEGFNENTGKQFPACAQGLVCQFSGLRARPSVFACGARACCGCPK